MSVIFNWWQLQEWILNGRQDESHISGNSYAGSQDTLALGWGTTQAIFIPGVGSIRFWFLIQSTLKVLDSIDRDVDNILSKNTKPPFIAFYRLTLTTTSWFHSKSSFETSATLLKAQLIPVSNAECSLAMGRQRKKRSGNHVFAKILARFQNILTSHWQSQTLFVDCDSRRVVGSQRTWFVPPMRSKGRTLVR